jgi:CRP-like cAMP-binding protein
MTTPNHRPSAGAAEQSFQACHNRILSALPPEELRRIAPHLQETRLAFKQSLSEPDRPIEQVCFPDIGVCSVMSVMRSGATAEVGTIGNEGMTGLALFYGDVTEPSESIVQVPGVGRTMPSDVFQAEMARRGMLYTLISHYAHALLVQLMQSAACNALHSVEERTCKWLLMTHDRVEGDAFKLTHEFLGLMLGVRRSSVTLVAHQLQRAGLIDYRLGTVTILDRKGLEETSCECYTVLRVYFDRFLQQLST